MSSFVTTGLVCNTVFILTVGAAVIGLLWLGGRVYVDLRKRAQTIGDFTVTSNGRVVPRKIKAQNGQEVIVDLEKAPSPQVAPGDVEMHAEVPEQRKATALQGHYFAEMARATASKPPAGGGGNVMTLLQAGRRVIPEQVRVALPPEARTAKGEFIEGELDGGDRGSVPAAD